MVFARDDPFMISHSRRWQRQVRRAGRIAGTARHDWQTRQSRHPRRRSSVTGAGDRPLPSTDPGPEPELTDPRDDESPERPTSPDSGLLGGKGLAAPEP